MKKKKIKANLICVLALIYQIVLGAMLSVLINGGIGVVEASSDIEMTFIGDSLTVSVKDQLESEFPNSNVEAEIGIWLSNEGAHNDGVKILKSATIKDLIVVGLGTNGGITKAQMQRFMDAVPSNVKRIAFITTDSEGGVNNSAINSMLKSTASDDDRVDIIDWASYSKNHGRDFYSSDDIHFSNTGANEYVKFISGKIKDLYSDGLGNASDKKGTGCVPKEVTASAPDWSKSGGAIAQGGLDSHQTELIRGLNVRRVEPEWMSIDNLNDMLSKVYPDHQLEGMAEDILRLADKYAIFSGIFLGQALKETSWGRNGCPTKDAPPGDYSPYNFGCVIWAAWGEPNDTENWQAKKFGLKASATNTIHGRYWPIVEDKKIGIEIAYYVMDDILKRNNGKTYFDLLKVYSPEGDQGNQYADFESFPYSVIANFMQFSDEDFKEQKVKEYGGCGDYSEGGDSDGGGGDEIEYEFNEDLIPNMPKDRDFKDTAWADKLFMSYDELTELEKRGVENWKAENRAKENNDWITWSRRFVALIGLIFLMLPVFLSLIFVSDMNNPIANAPLMELLTFGKVTIDFDAQVKGQWFSDLKPKGVKVLALGDLVGWSVLFTVMGILVLSGFVYVQLGNLVDFGLMVMRGAGF